MNKTPIYINIKNYLLELIDENKDDAKYMLPSESKLCIKFGTSRIPVRQALEELVNDGFIVKRQGKGAFINRENAYKNKQEHEKLIALILPDISTSFLQKVTLGVKHYCHLSKTRYVLLPSFSSSFTEQDNIKLAHDLHCDGILLMPVDEESYNDELLRLITCKKPCILLDRKLIGLNIPSVSSDHLQMGLRATTLLLEKGLQQIAYFALTDIITSINERVQGYLQALASHNNSNSYVVNITGIKGETLHEKMEYFLSRNPDINGIILNSGIPTASAIRAFSSLHKEIGKDYSIVSFDDDNLLIDLCMNIHTDTITQDAFQIGHTACELLIRQITAGILPPPKTIIPLPQD